MANNEIIRVIKLYLVESIFNEISLDRQKNGFNLQNAYIIYRVIISYVYNFKVP